MNEKAEQPPKRDRAALAAGLPTLLQLKEAGAPITKPVAEISHASGYSERQVWRILRNGCLSDRRRPGWEPDQAQLEELAELKGNITRWNAERVKAAGIVVSRPTASRAVSRVLAPGGLALLRRGEKGLQENQLYMQWGRPARNVVWETDCWEVPAPVLLPRHTRPVDKIWIVAFEDVFSRAIMGWAPMLEPTAAGVLGGLHNAIDQAGAFAPLGGIPLQIRTDNGKEFLADDLDVAGALLGFDPHPVQPKTPWHKGKIERVFRTLGGLLSDLPNYSDGPLDSEGKVHLVKAALEGLPLRVVIERVEVAIRDYNNAAHSELNGMSPLEAWVADSTALRTATPDQLSYLLEAREERKVMKFGVLYQGTYYTAKELNRYVNKRVTIAFAPLGADSVDVYSAGRFVCTAREHDWTSQDERIDFMRQRAMDTKPARDAQKAAKAKAQRQVKAAASAIQAAPAVPLANLAEQRAASSAKRHKYLGIKDLGTALTEGAA